MCGNTLLMDCCRQRSLYPLYPPPVNVAQRCAETIRRCALNVIPHVMIVPSLLAPMIKACSFFLIMFTIITIVVLISMFSCFIFSFLLSHNQIAHFGKVCLKRHRFFAKFLAESFLQYAMYAFNFH